MSTTVPPVTLCLWYNGDAEAAATFYAETFPNTAVHRVNRAPTDFPGGKAGDALVVEFTLLGLPCIGLNGGSAFPHTQAFSMQVSTQSQEETDRYWDAITSNGGAPNNCGWCRDRFGVYWQITPVALTQGMADSDPAARQRVFQAMMTMDKIDIAQIEAARKG